MREKKMTTTVTVTATSFPEEVMMEILSRLPVKSLMRFKCVSKTWFELLSIDTHFAKLHLDQSINTATATSSSRSSSIIYMGKEMCFYYSDDYTSCDNNATVLGLPFIGEERFSLPRDLAICGICNGLVLLANREFPIVYVWNPLTREHITISLPSKISKKCNMVYGFGLDQGSDAYKVLQISCSISSRHTRSQVRVYSLGTGLWRTLEEIPYKIRKDWKSVVLVGGALYLFVARPGSSSYDVIVAFDLIDESFHEIPQPDGLDLSKFLHNHTAKLGKLDGSLCLCRLFSSSGDEMEFRIWVMKKYGVGNSWTELFRISSLLLIPHWLDNLTLLGVARNKDLIFLRSHKTIFLYNSQTNSVRSLLTFEFPIIYAYLYMGSLVSPKLIDEITQITDDT